MWTALGFWGQLAAVSFVVCTLAIVHHRIDKGGYDRAMAEVAAADQARKDEAQKQITDIGEKHEKIRTWNRAQGGYNAPASPLAAAAAARLHANDSKPARR